MTFNQKSFMDIFDYLDQQPTVDDTVIEHRYITINLNKTNLIKLRSYLADCKHGLHYADELLDFLKNQLTINTGSVNIGNLFGVKLKGTASTAEPEILIYIYNYNSNLVYSYSMADDFGDIVATLPAVLAGDLNYKFSLLPRFYRLPFLYK